MSETPDVLSISLDIGAGMLRCGADMHRVEDTVSRINRAYGAEEIEVFSISYLLLVTVGHGEGSRTESRRVTSYATDLARLEALNDLSRRICRETPPPETVCADVAALCAPRRAEQLLSFLGYLLGSAGFCIYFGGSPADAAVSSLIGALLWLSDQRLRSKLPNRLVYTLLTAFAMGLLGGGIARLIPALHADKIMIGDIMLQIPGLLLINGLRDMLLGDTMTGLFRTIDALLTAAFIAVGFAGALLVLPAAFNSGTQPPAIQLLCACAGTLGFSLLYNLRRCRLLPAVLAGLLTTAVYLLCTRVTGNALFCYMAAAVAAGAYAELAARVLHAPTTVFLFPGLIPLLPGAGLFYTMVSIVHGSTADFLFFGLQTVHAAIGIAVGVLFSSILVLLFRRTLRHIA